MVQSLRDSSLVGYTDAITIAPSNPNSPGPEGTSIALLPIPASTSAGSSSFSGEIPAPTAVTNVETTKRVRTASETGTASALVAGATSSAVGASSTVGANSGAGSRRVGGAAGAMLGLGVGVALLL